MFGGFGVKTHSFWVGLQVWQVWKLLVLPKVTKFWPKYFGSYWWKTIKRGLQIMFGGFGGKTNSFWVGLQVWQVWQVLVLPKVTKFWPTYFGAVLMEKDKICTTNPVRGFPGQNQLILGWFESLESFGTTKSDKFW